MSLPKFAYNWLNMPLIVMRIENKGKDIWQVQGLSVALKTLFYMANKGLMKLELRASRDNWRGFG